MSRRAFLRAAAGAGACLASPAWAGPLDRWLAVSTGVGPLEALIREAPRASYWVASGPGPVSCQSCHDAAALPTDGKPEHDQKYVRCLLCARNCMIAEGKRGMCHARINVDGELRSLVYGRPITTHVDPIEKKPFYHFLPGSTAYSMATSGCPLRCKFCQNWSISQARPEDHARRRISPAQMVKATRHARSPVIAFTYNEPTVFTEYLLDIASLARKQGLRSVLVSCGFMNEAPLAAMCEVLAGIKFDLKGFSKQFYRNVCQAELGPVLRSIKQVGRSGVHLEIVNLVVPTLNDSDKLLAELAKWVVGEVGPDVPIHFTRFHPDYKLRNLPPTPVATLERARQIAMQAGVRYAFVGNVPGHPGNQTYCPSCGKVLIARSGFFVRELHLKGGKCAFCSAAIAGVWQ